MRAFLVVLLVALIAILPTTIKVASADSINIEVAGKLLPDKIGDARAIAKAGDPGPGFVERIAVEEFGIQSVAIRAYAIPQAETARVTLVKTKSDSFAYALLVNQAVAVNSLASIQLNQIGTASLSAPGAISFFKGSLFVEIASMKKEFVKIEAVADFARSFANQLDKGEADIPVLIKHLPNWETARSSTTYALHPNTLRRFAGHEAIFDAVEFAGGAETAIADYNGAKLIVHEYTTPKLAFEGDARIIAKLNELRSAGQRVPTAYKRVGNYSVFVFDASDEKTANDLINGVKYEQDVQWLGHNPFAVQRVRKGFVMTTAGIIVAVLKASGLSLVICFGIGGLLGGLVFRRRRARIASAYTDAGGIVQLNIDDFAVSDRSRLLDGRKN